MPRCAHCQPQIAVVPAALPADQGAAGWRASTRGEWRPGEAIPSEIELARRFGVSQGTVRKAIDALAADNLVVRRQGKGTFVATHTEEKTLAVPLPAHPPQRRARRVSGEPAPRRAARQGVRRRRAPARAQGRRLRWSCCGACSSIVGRAGGARRDHAAGGAVPRTDPATRRGLSRLDVQLLRNAVRRPHAEGAGEAAAVARRRRDARASSACEAGEPLLAVERVTLTYGDRPVEWRRGLCATRHHYVNELADATDA